MSLPRYVIINNNLVPYEEATVHLLTPAVKYGGVVFEGLRAYWNADKKQLYLFRLKDHLERFRSTLKIMQFNISCTPEEIHDMAIRVLRENEIRHDVHLRIAAYMEGTGRFDTTEPVSVMCAAYGRASGPLQDKMTSAGVVSWRRIDDTAMPPRLKVSANYHNARLGTLEAKGNGYDEALFLTRDGHVTESGGACFMMIRDDVLTTPAVTDSILESITRRTILDIASNMGARISERAIDRTELYFCQEAFLCGTGAEIKPIVSIDRQPVGNGDVGEMTSRLWNAYEALVRGMTAEGAGHRLAIYD